MNNKRSKQATEPQKQSANCFQNGREVLNQQCKCASCKRTNERIKNLESSISLLTGFLVGHLVGELISAVFLR